VTIATATLITSHDLRKTLVHARRAARRYDGPILGTAGVTRNITTGWTATTFDFGEIPVPAGSTIAFVAGR
jgi:hypothetical protein